MVLLESWSFDGVVDCSVVVALGSLDRVELLLVDLAGFFRFLFGTGEDRLISC